MFSISTMASSTRMPMTSVSASRVTMLSEKPSSAMTAKVGISDSGMATAVISVARQSRRNRNTTEHRQQRAHRTAPPSWRGSSPSTTSTVEKTSVDLRCSGWSASSLATAARTLVVDLHFAGAAGASMSKPDHRLAVEAREAAQLGQPSPHVGDVAEPHAAPAARARRGCRASCATVCGRAEGADGLLRAADVGAAARQVGVGVCAARC